MVPVVLVGLLVTRVIPVTLATEVMVAALASSEQAGQVVVAVVMLEVVTPVGLVTPYAAEQVPYQVAIIPVAVVGALKVGNRVTQVPVQAGVPVVPVVLVVLAQGAVGTAKVATAATVYLDIKLLLCLVRGLDRLILLGAVEVAAGVTVTPLVAGVVQLQVIPVTQVLVLLQVTQATPAIMLPHRHRIVYL